MRVLLLVILLIAVKNASATCTTDTLCELSLKDAKQAQCYEDQTELIQENEDSYTPFEIAKQYEDLKTICGPLN